MIEVTRVNEDRELQTLVFPNLSHMTVLDNALGILNNEGDQLLATYADGEWIAARVVEDGDG